MQATPKVFNRAHVTYAQLFAALMIMAQAFCMFEFAMGYAHIFGTKITVITFVELLFGIFYTTAYYRGILSVLVGILYIIATIFIIKNLITSLVYLGKIGKVNEANADKLKNYVLWLGIKTGQNYLFAIALAYVCYWIKKYPLPKELYLFMIIWVAVFIITRLMYAVVDEKSGFLIGLANVAAGIFVAIPPLVVLMYIKDPFVETFVFHVKNIFIDTQSASVALIAPIVSLVLMIFCFSALGDANSTVNLQQYFMRGDAIKILVAETVMVGGAISVYIWSGYGTRIDLEKIIEIFIPYLPMMCAAIGMLLATCIPMLTKKIVREPTGLIDVNGVLRIKMDSKEIYEYEYKDNRSITEIYIPANVEKIGSGAFYGCGSVKAIYCEHACKPMSWNSDWSLGCYATVHWGYNSVKNEAFSVPTAAQSEAYIPAPAQTYITPPAAQSGAYIPTPTPTQSYMAPPAAQDEVFSVPAVDTSMLEVGVVDTDNTNTEA